MDDALLQSCLDRHLDGPRRTKTAEEADEHVAIGSARTYGEGVDLTIVTCGNGVLLSLRVARRLAGRGGTVSSRRILLSDPRALAG